ncbi:DUF4157 domain-containing protein [Aliiglaciecola sp. CAU 1673]|uniref:eCIS core domain-containing protein n=1 Tax=Aliiglaciecola sp. CAU 1673 TaxID=3032595 RepID=UPI0023DC3ABF|nr:DUF4157 domain-containing protein [Aliiglaciecola sp. CAU 1673]MDF2177180.1 DUF4157 domain-containing protein [Aliiglaciecola sp. CAU 1673]
MKMARSALDKTPLLPSTDKKGRIANPLASSPRQLTQFAALEQLNTGPRATAQAQQLNQLLPDQVPVQRQPNDAAANRTGLPDNLKTGLESLSGLAMDDVKVHFNSSKPAALQAHAYAQGNQIHLAPGQEKHLPHEAWHVVQQKQGRVTPTINVGGAPVNDSPALEQEADSMGAKALQMKSALNAGDNRPVATPQVRDDTTQRMVALALNDKDKEDDLVIMTNLQYALSYAGGPVVDFGPSADFSTMKAGEELMLLEHGSPGKIQSFGASKIVEILTKEGKAVPAHIAGVIVLACSAGLPEKAKDESSSLVAIISKGLSEKGIHVVVDGKRGLALTSPSTGERAVRPDKQDEYMKLQHQIVIKYGFDGEVIDVAARRPDLVEKYGPKVVKKLKPAMEILKQDYKAHKDLFEKDPAAMTLEEKARHMARITKPFYQELVHTADKKGFLYAEFKGEQYALGTLIMNF